MSEAIDGVGLTAEPKPAHAVLPEEGYARFEEYVRLRVAAAAGPLLTVMPDDDPATREAIGTVMWRTCFLDRLPADRRQHYTCRCCEQFVRAYGGLAVVHGDGTTGALLWSALAAEADMVPPFFRPAVRALADFVESLPVRGVFLDAAETWGKPSAGGWTHLSGTPHPDVVHAVTPTESVSQAVAARREGFKMVKAAIDEFEPAVAAAALETLRLEAVPNGEKALGVAEWFNNLHRAVACVAGYGVRGSKRVRLEDNLIWRAVAASPPTFHHVRSTMIGTLLADIKDQKSPEEVRRAWVQKMDPGRYRRAQVAPTEGQVAAANRLAETLGITPAHLARRYATLADIPAQAKRWTPPVAKMPTSRGGTFSEVKTVDRPQPPEPAGINPPVMTWTKFAATVLDSALEVKLLVPHGRASFYGLLTATDPAGPAIFQWDGLTGCARNPVNWYVERHGSLAARWGLTPGAWAAVAAVLSPPYRWNNRPEAFAHHMDRAFLVLAGARDTVPCSLCLFDEVLRSELHPIRAVIEQFSQQGVPTGRETGDANGYVLTKAGAAATLWVRTAATAGVYRIDRWD